MMTMYVCSDCGYCVYIYYIYIGPFVRPSASGFVTHKSSFI